MRNVPLSVLEQVSVAAPCPADWAAMTGDERVRRCGQCRLNVYNISEMTRDEAEGLIRAHEGRLCVRYYQREDGTILVKDCPTGLAAIRAKAAKMVTRLAGALMVLLSAGAVLGQRSGEERRLSSVEPFASLSRWMAPPSTNLMVLPNPRQMRLMMGEMVPVDRPGRTGTQ